MLINRNGKDYQERNDVFSDEYIFVPKEYEEIVKHNLGYLNLEIEDNIIKNITISEAQKDYDEKITSIKNEIVLLKQNLSNTDYKAIKYAEGLLSKEEYAEIKTQRQEWRDRINQLEAEV